MSWLAASCVLWTSAAGASTAPDPGSPPPSTVAPLPLKAVTEDLRAQARAEVASATEASKLAQAAQARAMTKALADTNALQSAMQHVSRLDQRQRDLAVALHAAHDRLRDYAVAVYVDGGAGTPASLILGAQSVDDLVRRDGLVGSIAAAGAAAMRAYKDGRAAADDATRSAVGEFQDLAARSNESQRALVQSGLDANRAASIVAGRRYLLSLANAGIAASATDIPSMVLDAYEQAAASAQKRGCRIQWWALAGVGRVESDHGRSQDAQLAANGDLVPHILGPVLDGSNGSQAIPAGSLAKFTGDTTWDHAVGPMQFISSTWDRWGRDGTGDGVADPNNIYDAAAATAAYLCAASTDLVADPGLTVAYHSYNHSDDYVAAVLAMAHAYKDVDATGHVPPIAATPMYRTLNSQPSGTSPS